ncbi:MAG TPA: hypothetical protein VI318_01625 [Baekduia sp.]
MPPLDQRERAILAAVDAVRDRSVASPELATRVWTDFGRLWELSQYRTTLLDALAFTRAGSCSALELGAGMGSVTRWLAEHFATVHAYEGSDAHAAAAYARVRGLRSASVLAGDPRGVRASEAYDLVTLMGGAVDAELLSVAANALRTDGLALVTVANPDGLKYINGAHRDDDARVAFATAGEIERLARAAGFAAVDVLLPFPDHRQTTTIVDPVAFGGDPDAANWLLGTAPNRGSTPRPRVAYASETLLQRDAVRDGRLVARANSYALLCWREDAARGAARLGLERGWAARHWSLDRRPACRKRVTLTAAGAIVNELAAGGPAKRDATVELGLIEHRLADEPRRRGPVVALAALEAIVAEGPEAPALRALVERYAAWLTEEFGTGRVDDDGVPLLRGDALDAIWTNVLDDGGTGRWEAVDREWAFRGALPLDFLVWRALADLPLRFAHEAGDVDAYALVRACGVMDGEHRLSLALELQDAFHSAAGTGATPTPGPRVQALADVSVERRRFRVLARAEEVIASPTLLKAYAKAFAGTALATLVLFAGGDATANLPALQAAIAAAGLDEDTMPDTLLVDADSDEDGEAVLTTTSWGTPRLRHFGPDDLPALRALADRRWSEKD